ncbi:TPA: phage terminase large subunit family protein, partial [Stenotrophomonas maltophilia]|nr:phage terminase large subunit family protein [Stenotrophomonas maltophilia]
GITINHVGTVAAKHYLYSRLSADAERKPENRMVHLSDQLPEEFFPGLVSEVYNPVKNRFEKKVTRNEPLDTWVYAYAATHHPEVRINRFTRSDWDLLEQRLAAPPSVSVSRETPAAASEADAPTESRETPSVPRRQRPAQPRGMGRQW